MVCGPARVVLLTWFSSWPKVGISLASRGRPQGPYLLLQGLVYRWVPEVLFLRIILRRLRVYLGDGPASSSHVKKALCRTLALWHTSYIYTYLRPSSSLNSNLRCVYKSNFTHYFYLTQTFLIQTILTENIKKTILPAPILQVYGECFSLSFLPPPLPVFWQSLPHVFLFMITYLSRNLFSDKTSSKEMFLPFRILKYLKIF